MASAMGVARMPTQGSWRPVVTTSTGSPLMFTLRPGSRADLAILDEAGDVAETWIGGHPVWSAQPG